MNVVREVVRVRSELVSKERGPHLARQKRNSAKQPTSNLTYGLTHGQTKE